MRVGVFDMRMRVLHHKGGVIAFPLIVKWWVHLVVVGKHLLNPVFEINDIRCVVVGVGRVQVTRQPQPPDVGQDVHVHTARGRGDAGQLLVVIIGRAEVTRAQPRHRYREVLGPGLALGTRHSERADVRMCVRPVSKFKETCVLAACAAFLAIGGCAHGNFALTPFGIEHFDFEFSSFKQGFQGVHVCANCCVRRCVFCRLWLLWLL